LLFRGDVLYVAVSEPHVDPKTQSPVYFKVAMALNGGGLFIIKSLAQVARAEDLSSSSS
jgi:hypothetical protein